MEKQSVHNEQASKRKRIKIYLAVGIVILAMGAVLLSIRLLNTNEPEQPAETHQTGKLKQFGGYP